MSVIQVCSLCCTTCSEYKTLQTDLDEFNEIYNITVKYFDPILLTKDESTNSDHHPALCRDCWFHINDFHEFQQQVLKTRMLWEDKAHLKPLVIDVKQEEVIKANVPTSNTSDKDSLDKSEDEEYLFENNLEHGDPEILKSCENTPVSVLNQEFIRTNMPTPNTTDNGSSDETGDDEDNIFEDTMESKQTNGKDEGNGMALEEYKSKDEHNLTTRRQLRQRTKIIKANVPTPNTPDKNSLDRSEDEEYLFESNSEHGDPESLKSYENTPVSVLNQEVIQTNVPTSNTSDNGSSDETGDDEDNIFENTMESKQTNGNDEQNDVALDEDMNKDVHNLTTKRQLRLRTKIINMKDTNPPETIKKPKVTKDTKAKARSSYNLRESDALIAQWKPELICDLCNETATDLVKLRSHFKKKHKTRFYIKCCNRKLYRRGVLVDHIQLHLNPEIYKCDICGKSSTTKKNFMVHKKVMHEYTKQFKCNVCEKQFNRKVSLERHLLTHTSSKDFICSECGKGYFTEKLLKYHIKYVHNVDCVCEQCGKTIHGAHAFKNHLKEHAGIERRKFICDVCGIELLSAYGIKCHKSIYHSDGSTLYVCSVCGKVSPNELALVNHKRLVHEAERTHKCTFCDKAFKQPRLLREHIAKHTGEDLYQCSHCPQKFKSNSLMHHHRKKKHPIEYKEGLKNRRKGPKINSQDKKQIAIY